MTARSCQLGCLLVVDGIRLQHIDRFWHQSLNKVGPQEFHPLAHIGVGRGY